MTPEEFVKALREVVLARAVDSTLSAIEKPPGRRPGRELLEASAWYQGLSDQDRAPSPRWLRIKRSSACSRCWTAPVLSRARRTREPSSWRSGRGEGVGVESPMAFRCTTS